ncbi:ankyrin repeat and fibronectin type-III domain-containing protein 1 [Tachyglossus aculeatus]|uniref:ankyrin repeat and fibronectin type-III domain-containing protein 1 n=1 Tax=Tachyglossus aculeatus TaxID=9261 RepID=UPI0018F7C73E|nr:ankyrin repeat and fibronectin type-III domain-containing protein 1 [Tachyglossus aculeatus]
MSQQIQGLLPSQARRNHTLSSPNAAKRLYRNLSEKLKGSHTSFDEAYFRARTERLSLRKTSVNFQGNEAMFEAVEQQDLDAVQGLLDHYTVEELDLNTPNSEGLTPLDIAIMTNNVPIAKTLLRNQARESPQFVSLESRSLLLSTLVQETERRVAELASQVEHKGSGPDGAGKEKQLKAWEWRYRLYKRMQVGYEHARAPEAPTCVCLTVTGSTSLTVTFQEPLSVNAAVVTKYRVEWSCSRDFSPVAGEIIVDQVQALRCSITGLTTGQNYFIRVSAHNMKGWGPAQTATPASAAPSSWKDCNGGESRNRGRIKALESLLQEVQAIHRPPSCRENSKLPTPGRKQSVSRSLKHLFHSSNKFVKTLKRGLYIAVIFYYKDNMLVTNEDQIPIVEIDDSHTSNITQDFLWFTKLSCMWEDIRWLRQSVPNSMSSSTALQARQKMLAATAQLQNLLGTHNLGRVYYEPIKDRHGNMLIVTIREVESLYSFFNGKWMPIAKLQSQRKSLSTPEEPTALDILFITIQDILAYQKRSQQRLAAGLYLGYLKLSSSVDQIKVLVTQKLPNILCHVKIRENSNVSKEEWDWLQKHCGSEAVESLAQAAESPSPSFLEELGVAVRALLRQASLPLQQAKHFRLYTQEVLELGHNVSFLLLLPPSDEVCTAPGQTNPYPPHSGFLHLPLQMFELVHFCTYKEKFISLYCRLSAVVDLDALSTQQSLREAISDGELSAAKQRHQQVLDYTQQIDETWREMRWIMEALQYARFKQPAAGLPISRLIDLSEEPIHNKGNSSSSPINCLPSPPPSPSPETQRRKAVSDSQPCSDEEGCSEVFLPTDSDYDSSDALSPRELDLVYRSSHDIAQQALHGLSGSAPDVLQVHDTKGPPALRASELCTDSPDNLSSSGLGAQAPDGSDTGSRPPPLSLLGQRKLARHQRCGYVTRHHRWLQGRNEMQSLSLSEGVYTQRLSRATEWAPKQAPLGEQTGAPGPALKDEQTRAQCDEEPTLYLPHTSCLLEDAQYKVGRPTMQQIHMEPSPTALVCSGGEPWGLDPLAGGRGHLPNPSGSETSPESQETSRGAVQRAAQEGEVFSSVL